MSTPFWRRPTLVISVLSALGLLTAVACGASATPTPPPTNTPVPVATNTPTATPRPATPTPTSIAGVVATPTATSVPTPTPVPSVKPKTGGIVRQLSGEDPGGFDPHINTSASASIQNAKLYSNLVWQPDKNLIVPDLATSYELSADGTTWTFHLNPNAKYQTGYTPANPRDGTQVTAADAKWSLEKIMGLHKDPISARAGLMKEFIAIDRPDNGLEVVDNQTLKVHVKSSTSALLVVLATGFAGIVPDGITSNDMVPRSFGSGAFALKSFQRGAEWDYARNPTYFKPGLPYLDGWSLIEITDQSVSQAAFLTGKLDLTSATPTPDNKPIFAQKVQAGQIYMLPYSTQCRPQVIDFNVTKPPFDNLKLRQAINMAIDRQAYIQVEHQGYAVPHLFLDTNLDGTGYGKTLDQIMQLPGYRLPHDADLAQAKQIVQSLYPNGLSVTMMTRNTGGGVGSYPFQAEFLSGELKKIGINATIQLLDTNTYFARAASLDYTINNYFYCQTTATPEELFGGYFITGASRNWTGYSSPKVDAGYKEMLAITDPVAHKQKAQALEDLVYADLPMAPLPVQNTFRIAFSYIRDLPITQGVQYTWDKDELIWRSDM